MKYLSGFAILLLFLNSCKKDEKTVENDLKQDSIKLNHILNKDSLTSSSSTLIIEPLAINVIPEVGKTIFNQGKNELFYFNLRSNTGEIKINGKTHVLDMLNFTDNEYHISGDGIKITALDGDFKDMTGDCLYGNFPEVTVELNSQKVVLKNISVQDCPAY